MIRPYLRRRSLNNSYWYMNHLSSALATTADTGGSLALFEVTICNGMEPPAHIHSRETEAIYILDGRLTGWSGSTAISAGIGELVNLPVHESHGWKITPGADGRTGRGLLFLMPGDLEAYFLRFSEPAPTLALPEADNNAYVAKMQESIGQVIADAAEFGIQWMPPDYAPTLTAAPEIDRSCISLLGERFKPLAPAVETGGTYSAIEWTSPPQSCLPRHRHHHADEAFYVLEGQIDITAGDDFAVTAEPGDFVFLPKGIPPHAPRRRGLSSRALQILTPGGVEVGLTEAAALSPEEMTLERLAAIAERNGLTLIPE